MVPPLQAQWCITRIAGLLLHIVSSSSTSCATAVSDFWLLSHDGEFCAMRSAELDADNIADGTPLLGLL